MYLLCWNNKQQVYSKKTSQLIKWESTKKTHHYHWWPMKKTDKIIEDPKNNLYAINGGLYKYDNIFGTKSVTYQKKEHYRHYNSTKSDAGWAGFCDLATTLSCLYCYPRHNVQVQVGDKISYFSRKDIESLMIIACQNSVQRWNTVYYGERNDGIRGDDKHEPYPTQLLDILNKLCQDDAPFAMDIESGTAVWNYAFDSVNVKKYDGYPSKFIDKVKECVPTTGTTEYYNFQINSTGFSGENQDIWGWVNNTDGKKTQNWLSDWHPDFLWRKTAKTDAWTGSCIINNEVAANNVYKIYKHSISDKTNGVILQLSL